MSFVSTPSQPPLAEAVASQLSKAVFTSACVLQAAIVVGCGQVSVTLLPEMAKLWAAVLNGEAERADWSSLSEAGCANATATKKRKNKTEEPSKKCLFDGGEIVLVFMSRKLVPLPGCGKLNKELYREKTKGGHWQAGKADKAVHDPACPHEKYEFPACHAPFSYRQICCIRPVGRVRCGCKMVLLRCKLQGRFAAVALGGAIVASTGWAERHIFP